MRKHPRLIIAILVLGVAAALAYAGWTIDAASHLGSGWAGLDTAWPYLLAGVVTVGVAIAGFLRLAFFSSDRGYDDRADPNRR